MSRQKPLSLLFCYTMGKLCSQTSLCNVYRNQMPTVAIHEKYWVFFMADSAKMMKFFERKWHFSSYCLSFNVLSQNDSLGCLTVVIADCSCEHMLAMHVRDTAEGSDASVVLWTVESEMLGERRSQIPDLS